MLLGGNDLNHITNTLQILLRQLQKWGLECNLRFSPEKTVSLLFNRKGRNIARPLKIEGRKIKYVEEVRYLGLIIDNKLNWKTHINGTLNRCTTLMRRLAAKTTGLYGPKPKLMKWTYTGIVRPKLTYGCLAWGHKVNLKDYGKKLNTLNRVACMASSSIVKKPHHKPQSSY